MGINFFLICRIPNELIKNGSDHLNEKNEYLLYYMLTINITKEVKNNQDVPFCLICFVEFEINQNVKILPCNHIFDEKCIFEWFRLHSSCPKCKFVIGKKLIDHLSI